jgi:diguanylate cyclase (GGDEF)-like protein
MKIRKQNLKIAKNTALRLGVIFFVIPFIGSLSGVTSVVDWVLMATIAVASLYALDNPSTNNFSILYGFSAVLYTPNPYIHSLGFVDALIIIALTFFLTLSPVSLLNGVKILFPIIFGELLLVFFPNMGQLEAPLTILGVAFLSGLISLASDKISIKELFFGSIFSDLIYISTSYLGYAYSPLFALVITGLILKEQNKSKVMLARDMVSGLVNYEVFIGHIRKCQDRAIETSVIVFSISNYQEITNQLGVSFGDRVVRKVALSVKANCRKKDLISRLSGDIFGICIQAEYAQINLIVERIASQLNSTSFKSGDTEVYINAKFGIATLDGSFQDPSKIVDYAYLAARRATFSSNDIAIFDETLDVEGSRKIDLVSEIPRAIKNNEFFLVYQPKVTLENQIIEGVEALIRWQHPIRGVVMPDQFIPSAEQTEAIKPLSMWVVREAIKQAAIWRGRGIQLQVAVNVSFANLLDPNFVSEIVDLIRLNNLPANIIEIEITENVGAVNSPVFFDSINKLRSNRISIALDDFGTGYSSLSYVSQIQADTIKIDKEFVRDLCSKRQSAIIAKSILGLAKEFGYTTVAEGVEDQETLFWLKDNGCSIAQGYFISKPLPAETVAQWVHAFNAISSTPSLSLEGDVNARVAL